MLNNFWHLLDILEEIRAKSIEPLLRIKRQRGLKT